MARTPLAQFVLDRLYERRETPEQFALRNGINPSGFYKLLRGEYTEPRQSTLDKIAGGLGLSPAELLIAIGRGGGSEADADEAEFLAIFRQVPEHKKQSAKEMLIGLRVETHDPVPPTKRRTERTAKSPETDLREIDNTPTTKGKRGPLPTGNRKLQPIHRVRGPVVTNLYLRFRALANIWPNRDSLPAAAAV